MKKILLKKTKLYIQISMILGIACISSEAYSVQCVAGALPGSLVCKSLSTYPKSDNITSVMHDDYANLNTYQDVTVNATGAGSAAGGAGPAGFGIYVDGNGTLTADKFTITTNGNAADGIRINKGSYNFEITGLLRIEANGSSGDGINASNSNNSGAYITISGENAYIFSNGGIGVRSNLTKNTRGNRIIIGDKATIITKSVGGNNEAGSGYGVYSGDRYQDAVAIPVAKTSLVVIGNDSTISTSGKDAYAVYANKTGVIQLGSTTITTTGQEAHGIAAEDGAVQYGTYTWGIFWTPDGEPVSYKGGQVYLTGDTAVTVDTTKGSYAMYSSGDESLISSSDKDGNAKSGVYKVTGDIIADKQGKIDLTATDGTSILSKIDNNSDPSSGVVVGEIKFSMAGSSSQWKVAGDSYLDSLTLSDNAKVSFGYDYAMPNAVTTFNGTNNMTITTKQLSGSGLLEMRTAIANSNVNDLLVVTDIGGAKGNHQIFVDDSQTGSATGAEVITLVKTEDGVTDGGANFTLSNPSQYVDVGAYRFTLGTDTSRQTIESNVNAKDWVLTGSNIPTPPKPDLTDTAQNAANILNSIYLMSYIENQTLLQRMGQLRQSEGGDVWGRIYGGKLDSFGGKRLSGFDIDYYGMQIGVDRKVDNDAGNDIYYGIVGSINQGNVDYSVGDGKIKSYTIGVYGTYQNEDGFYIDGILKYVYMDNKFNTKTGGGYSVKGSGDTKGFAIGAEIGQRFYLGEESAKREGWYLEPQGQLTYSYQGDATIKATNGLRTDLDSYNSLLGRATIIAGYTIVDNENPVDIYLKTGFLKEFKSDTTYTFNHTEKEKYDFSGNWWDNGIGINMQLNKHHNLYTDIVYAVGNKFDQKQLNAGYRYSF